MSPILKQGIIWYISKGTVYLSISLINLTNGSLIFSSPTGLGTPLTSTA